MFSDSEEDEDGDDDYSESAAKEDRRNARYP
jgi:hypothetical protein